MSRLVSSGALHAVARTVIPFNGGLKVMLGATFGVPLNVAAVMFNSLAEKPSTIT